MGSIGMRGMGGSLTTVDQRLELVAEVRRIVERAGAPLAERSRTAAADRATARDVERKAVRRELVTAADRAVEREVVSALLALRPEDAILAEEGVLTPTGAISREGAEFLWVLDPIDGTTNFVHGVPFFAVALGLYRGSEPVLAVVYAPALARTYHAVVGGGAYRDDQRLQVSSTPELADGLLATGFSYVRDQPGTDDNLGRLGRVLPLCRDLRRLGSAELDLCAVADGTFDGYWELHLAPYDVAAGAIIVLEAGGRVTDLSGGEDWLFGGEILATNGALHDHLLSVVGHPGVPPTPGL